VGTVHHLFHQIIPKEQKFDLRWVNCSQSGRYFAQNQVIKDYSPLSATNLPGCARR